MLRTREESAMHWVPIGMFCFFNEWYNGWGLWVQHIVRRIQRYLPQEGKSICTSANVLYCPSSLKLNCGFLFYILETEDLCEEILQWLRWQYSKWSTKGVIAFSSNYTIIIGNPAFWQSVQTSENGAGITQLRAMVLGLRVWFLEAL